MSVSDKRKSREESFSPAKEFSDAGDDSSNLKCHNGYDISLGVERVEDLIELESKDGTENERRSSLKSRIVHKKLTKINEEEENQVPLMLSIENEAETANL